MHGFKGEHMLMAVLPQLDDMIGGGLVTLERANVIVYRPHQPDEEGRTASPSRAGEIGRTQSA